MAGQIFGSPFTPLTSGAGTGKYIGTGAAITWAVPDSGPGRALTATSKSVKFSVEGGTMRVCTDGTTATATLGVGYSAGFYVIENSAAELTAWSMFLPVGVTVYAEFGN